MQHFPISRVCFTAISSTHQSAFNTTPSISLLSSISSISSAINFIFSACFFTPFAGSVFFCHFVSLFLNRPLLFFFSTFYLLFFDLPFILQSFHFYIVLCDNVLFFFYSFCQVLTFCPLSSVTSCSFSGLKPLKSNVKIH